MDSPLPNNTFEVKAVIDNCQTDSSKAADAYQKNDGANEVLPNGMDEVDGPVPNSCSTEDTDQKNELPDGMNEIDGHLPETENCNTEDADQKNDGTNEVVPDGMNEVDGPVPDENREAETLANGGEQEKPSAELYYIIFNNFGSYLLDETKVCSISVFWYN